MRYLVCYHTVKMHDRVTKKLQEELNGIQVFTGVWTIETAEESVNRLADEIDSLLGFGDGVLIVPGIRLPRKDTALN